MIAVIQCAASKRASAGHMLSTDGTPIHFVADPRLAPADGNLYGRPDDRAAGGGTWRELLTAYNKNPGNNPLNLYPAFELYERNVYRRLVDKFGMNNVYILSAGWGLIRADFLTPSYDITFSASVDRYKRRLKTDYYADFQMLPANIVERVIFLGGKDYLPLFCRLTAEIRTPPIVFYNSANVPAATNCVFRRYETKTRTNWHYECADAIIDGAIMV